MRVRNFVQQRFHELRAIISQIDAKHALAPGPLQIPPNATPGELLTLALRHQSNGGTSGADPVAELRRIRRETVTGMREVRRSIEQAEECCWWLVGAAQFLKSGSPLESPPEGIPPYMVEHVRALKAYGRAGLIQIEDVYTKLYDAAQTGLALTATAQKNARKYNQTAGIALARQGSLYAERWNRPEMAEGLAKKADRLSAAYRREYANDEMVVDIPPPPQTRPPLRPATKRGSDMFKGDV